MFTCKTQTWMTLLASALLVATSAIPGLGVPCTWEDRTPAPGKRSGHAMAYDSVRGVAVLFGGVSNILDSPLSFYGDTWEWNGTAWTLRSTEGPSPRLAHAMAYDSARGVTVLFGGRDNTGLLGDTWEWDGTTWTLRSSSGPSPREYYAMVYDSARGVTVLFGGTGGGGDTWEWDGTTWMLRSGSGPSPRFGIAMTYDSARGVTVLFGGKNEGSNLGDTWEWDGKAWLQRIVSGPSARVHHAMAYDSARGVTVLFGGAEAGGETWEWDGTAWTPRSFGGPSARRVHAMAYDSARGVTVLFGGVENPIGYLGDTWVWDGTAWTLRGGPPARSVHAMAFDHGRKTTVLFGGFDGANALGDTWEWDGTMWEQQASVGPSARFGHAMVYDSARGVIVVFGGFDITHLCDTWEWNGTTWTLRSTSGPAPRFLHTMAYDSARGVTVLFGGSNGSLHGSGPYFSDTWEWDGAAWTLRGTTGPPPQFDHATAYDSTRGLTVLFGGYSQQGPEGDTWEWDGINWTLRSNSGPSHRYAHAMAYDSARGVTVLFGGREGVNNSDDFLGDIWEWDGMSWALRSNNGTPSAFHAMAYDSIRGTTVLFAGAGRFGLVSETWEYSGACDLPQACCLASGQCILAEQTACVAEGGQPQELGSVCLGDTNGDNVDQRCEGDCDGDAILDGDEANPAQRDCDRDGVCNGVEIANCSPGDLSCADCNTNEISDGCEEGACCLDTDNDGSYESCSQSNEQTCAQANGIWRGSCRSCPTQNAAIFPEPGGDVFVHVIGAPIDCLAETMRARGNCPPGGPFTDAWKSPPDASMCHNFGAAGHAIPASFFNPGSDPFTSSVCLEGVPLGAAGFGEADTLIQRLADPFERCALPSAMPVTVQIDIAALSMVSTAPMTVTYNGGQNPEQWTVAVDLSTEVPPSGTLTATKTHCNGGTYTSVLYVQPRFTFTKVSDPSQVRVLDTGLSDIPPVILDQHNPAPWVHDVDPNLGLTGDLCSTFHAGIEDQVPETSCDCNANTVRDKCDIEQETSADCNLNQIPDDCDLFTCNDSNPCTDETCILGTGCQYTPVVVLYADVFPFGGNGVIDVDDILRILEAFVDPVNFPEGDIEPCGADGDVDVDDILAELDAFQGVYLCEHPCPP